jgi:hypothetical protein
MEIQELRARIRQWKARTEGGEYVEDEMVAAESYEEAVDIESEIDVAPEEAVGYDDVIEGGGETDSLEADVVSSEPDPTYPPSDEVVAAPIESAEPQAAVDQGYGQEQAYPQQEAQPQEQVREPEQVYAQEQAVEQSAQPEAAQPQLTEQQLAAVQAYGQQLAQQGYSAEQIQAAQQQYVQQILAHQAAQQGGGGQS